ncbi:MAG: EVE domain-containing protein [Pirellulales bacterium]|nr:EVE domain-containing protein [Pirellulales bacterium]
MSSSPRFWLLKTEPESYSIDDLAAAPRQTTCWDGVRNYQARNFIRDDMRAGDQVLFYHSSTDPPAVVGTAVVVREAYPDHTAWDPKDHHYDPKASAENPIWQMVDIRLEHKFAVPIALEVLRKTPSLKGMELLRRGSRLSVQPVSPAEFDAVLQVAEQLAEAAGHSPRVARHKMTPPKGVAHRLGKPKARHHVAKKGGSKNSASKNRAAKG